MISVYFREVVNLLFEEQLWPQQTLAGIYEARLPGNSFVSIRGLYQLIRYRPSFLNAMVNRQLSVHLFGIKNGTLSPVIVCKKIVLILSWKAYGSLRTC